MKHQPSSTWSRVVLGSGVVALTMLALTALVFGNISGWKPADPTGPTAPADGFHYDNWKCDTTFGICVEGNYDCWQTSRDTNSDGIPDDYACADTNGGMSEFR